MGPRHLRAIVVVIMITTTANAAASDLDAEQRGTTGLSTGKLWFPGTNNESVNAKETSATPGACEEHEEPASTASGSLHTVPVGKLLRRFMHVDRGVHVGLWWSQIRESLRET